MSLAPPPNKYRDRAFLKAGIDSKTCSVDRKSHSAYVRKNLDQKFGFKKKLEHFFENKNPETFVISKISTKSH